MKMRRVGLVVLSSASVTVASACSLLFDAGQLASGSPGDGGPRADVHIGADAQSDAGQDACREFCDFFEREDPRSVEGQLWTSDEQQGGDLQIDTSTGSPFAPSLRVDLPSTSGDGTNASLVRRFERTPKAIHLRVAVQVGPLAGRKVHLATLDFPAGTTGPNSLFFLVDEERKLVLAEQEPTGANDDYTTLVQAFPTGWHTLDLDVDLTGNAIVNVAMDQNSVLSRRVTRVPFASGPFDLWVGVPYATPGQPVSVWFDSVEASVED